MDLSGIQCISDWNTHYLELPLCNILQVSLTLMGVFCFALFSGKGSLITPNNGRAVFVWGST